VAGDPPAARAAPPASPPAGPPPARRAEPLGVPRVELAQVAGRPLRAQVLLGAVDHPGPLGQDLFRSGVLVARAEHLGEQPRVAQRAAGEHDRRAAGVLEHPADVVGAVHAAGDDHRHRQLVHQALGQVVVRRALVADGGGARVERDPGHAGVLDEPLGHLQALDAARLDRGPQLDGDRQPRALGGRAGDRHRAVGVGDQRDAGAGLGDLGDRAAHVEVEQVGADAGHLGGRRAHDVRVLAEQLDRHRPVRALVGVDDQQLVERLAVAVVDGEARDHLRHGEPGPVALGLQAHEPVADAGERRQHDAVGDLEVAEAPGVVQGAHRAPA
jgi:hypothetical protein